MNQVLRRDKLAKLPSPEEKERSLLTLEDEEGDFAREEAAVRGEGRSGAPSPCALADAARRGL